MSYEAPGLCYNQQHGSSAVNLDHLHSLPTHPSHPHPVASPASSRPFSVAPFCLSATLYDSYASPDSFSPGLTPSIGTASSKDDSSGAADSSPGVTRPTTASSTLSLPSPCSFIANAFISRSRAAPKKVSHTRKTSPDYIKRPPNAFILFRSSCCSLDTPGVPNAVQLASLGTTDDRHISRIASVLWKALSLPDRQYWEERARDAKAEHVRKYPDYKYKPKVRGKDGVRSCKKLDPDELALEKQGCDDVARALVLVPEQFWSHRLYNLRTSTAKEEGKGNGTEPDSNVREGHPLPVWMPEDVKAAAAEPSDCRPVGHPDSPQQERAPSANHASARRCAASAVTLQVPYTDAFLDVDPRQVLRNSHMQEDWPHDWDTRGYHVGNRELFVPPEPLLAESHTRAFNFYHSAKDLKRTALFDYSAPVAFDQGSHPRTWCAEYPMPVYDPQPHFYRLEENMLDSICHPHAVDQRKGTDFDSQVYQCKAFDVGGPFYDPGRAEMAQPWSFSTPAKLHFAPATYVS